MNPQSYETRCRMNEEVSIISTPSVQESSVDSSTSSSLCCWSSSLNDFTMSNSFNMNQLEKGGSTSSVICDDINNNDTTKMMMITPTPASDEEVKHRKRFRDYEEEQDTADYILLRRTHSFKHQRTSQRCWLAMNWCCDETKKNKNKSHSLSRNKATTAADDQKEERRRSFSDSSIMKKPFLSSISAPSSSYNNTKGPSADKSTKFGQTLLLKQAFQDCWYELQGLSKTLPANKVDHNQQGATAGSTGSASSIPSTTFDNDDDDLCQLQDMILRKSLAYGRMN